MQISVLEIARLFTVVIAIVVRFMLSEECYGLTCCPLGHGL